MAVYDYEQFKKAIYDLTSIDLNCYKEKQMKRRIDTLIAKHHIDGYEPYVKLLKSSQERFDEFVNYLTINVSEFYRNPDQWEYMDKTVIPQLIHEFGHNLKIWSAACSTGDEPYSLVMALSRHLPLNRITILATDIDNQVLEKAPSQRLVRLIRYRMRSNRALSSVSTIYYWILIQRIVISLYVAMC